MRRSRPSSVCRRAVLLFLCKIDWGSGISSKTFLLDTHSWLIGVTVHIRQLSINIKLPLPVKKDVSVFFWYLFWMYSYLNSKSSNKLENTHDSCRAQLHCLNDPLKAEGKHRPWLVTLLREFSKQTFQYNQDVARAHSFMNWWSLIQFCWLAETWLEQGKSNAKFDD